MDQKRLRKKVERGKVKLYFPDQIIRNDLFGKNITVVGRGFSQVINDKKIGYGIDFGYDILRTSYAPDSLPIEARYMKVIENVVGKKELYDFFSKSNIAGLVGILGQRVSIDDALIFVKNVDFIHKMSFRHPLFRSELSVKESTDACEEFLMDLAANKIAELRAKNDIGAAGALFQSMEYAELINKSKMSSISNNIDYRVNHLLKDKTFSKKI